MRHANSSFSTAFFYKKRKKNDAGTKSVVDALSNVLLIYILRHAIQQNLIEQGILFALQDKRLNTALIAILQQPQNDWHIEQLAELATMSRANFIRIFQQHIGMSPGRFLTKVRLQSAAFFIKTITTICACHCFRSGISIRSAFL